MLGYKFLFLFSFLNPVLTLYTKKYSKWNKDKNKIEIQWLEILKKYNW